MLPIDFAARSLSPTGFAQAVEQVGVVLRPMPGDAVADIHVERGRSEGDRLVQCLLRLREVTKLAERCGEVAIGCRDSGKYRIRRLAASTALS
jgi:hypothetical protein